VIATLFAIIFKVLPDGVIRWRDAFTGAFFTAILFLIGKFLIGFYLGTSNIGVTYGTAASIVIILLWVYYSSIILFFGAEFTKVYTMNFGKGITPDKTAVFIVKQEVKELNLPADKSLDPQK
jgi:membrane protein